MNLVRLVRAGDPQTIKALVVTTALAGLANAALLALINRAAEEAAAREPLRVDTLLLYLIAAAIFFLCNRASLRGTNDLLQERLGDLRVRIGDKVRRADLRTLERMGRGGIYAIVAQETDYLAQNFPLLVGAAQSLFVVAFVLVYIAFLSQVSFIVIAFFAAVGLLVFWVRRDRLKRDMVAVHGTEARMLEALTDFAEGFQEIRLGARRNEALYARFTGIVTDLESAVVGIGRKWVALLLFSNAFLYAILGVVVLVLPAFFAGYTPVIYKIAAAAIFCIGPLTGVTSIAHLYSRADIGLGHVFRLEESLDAGIEVVPPAASRFRGFREIRLEHAAFDYRDAADQVTFEAGPWDFALRRNELVFFRGGNGSGKSTALKVLCGLYRPTRGGVAVDGVAVDDLNLQEYREIFSAVFSDFHLFDRLHGLEPVAPDAVASLLERMELQHKVQYRDGRFTTLDLSTGQRKRLALVVALLEDREVYLFDEWAADQDAHFREVFYTALLPELKARGKTVVVVTHDDRYWHLSDRVVTLDLGTIVGTEAHG
jgi:putative ATP-binding cassette transporter